jgi:hypothetical protein
MTLGSQLSATQSRKAAPISLATMPKPQSPDFSGSRARSSISPVNKIYIDP